MEKLCFDILIYMYFFLMRMPCSLRYYRLHYSQRRTTVRQTDAECFDFIHQTALHCSRLIDAATATILAMLQ